MYNTDFLPLMQEFVDYLFGPKNDDNTRVPLSTILFRVMKMKMANGYRFK